MRRRDRESIRDFDSAHDLFGGADEEHGEGYPDSSHGDHAEDDDRGEHAGGGSAHQLRAQPTSRVERRRHTRNHRRRRVLAVLALLIVVVLGISVWFIGVPIYKYLYPKDYDGAGTGSVIVTVRANEGVADIGETLEQEGVVGSKRAFTNAAGDDDRARTIQPGSYKLRRHMAADKALSLLLEPSSRVNSDTVVTEGATIADVERRLMAAPCTTAGTSARVCGLGLSRTTVTAALRNVRALGIPTDYLPNGKTPISAEGFLFPATYTFDEGTTAAEALQQMVAKFTDQARSAAFSAAAKKVGLTPYNALVVASMAQAEAKYPEDFAKVARVILNRLKINMLLKVDAVSAYAARLKGLDPTKTIYTETAGPYNTYRHLGLPPTPIGNPGETAMNGAVNPAPGNWLFYVNGDAAGHLFFTNSEAAFVKAAKKCKDNNWGCG